MEVNDDGSDGDDPSDESDGEGDEDRLTDAVAVAVAMEDGGEFGFLIAASAASSGMLLPPAAAAVVWAVLGNTLLPPLLFRPIFPASRHRHTQ